MLEHSLRWYCLTLCRAVLREAHAKSHRSRRDHLRHSSNFGGRTRRHRCSSATGAASNATYSPPFALWLVIGFLFYAMCFVNLRHVLSTGLVSSSQVFALVLTVMLLLANAFWSVLFFRWRDLRASFIAFVPYALLVAALVILLARTDPLGAILLSFYCIYLIYATRWGYHLW